MAQENILFLRIFFITTLVCQLAFIIKRICFILTKNNNKACYHYLVYIIPVFTFIIANFCYIWSEITGWEGDYNTLGFGPIFLIIIDLISLILFAIRSKTPYEVHIFYLPTKKKKIDINQSFIVIYDFIGRKEVIFLNQIDLKKSKYVIYKTSLISQIVHNEDLVYAIFFLNNGIERKIRLSNFINDPTPGLYEIRHFLKIPLEYIVKKE